MDTAVNANGYDIPAYSGSPAVELNGTRPTFSSTQKKATASYRKFSGFDTYERTGAAEVNVGLDTLAPSGSRQYIGNVNGRGCRFLWIGSVS